MQKSWVDTEADGRRADRTPLMTWRLSLRSHVRNLAYAAESLDAAEVEGALELMRGCSGLLLFSGVGQNLILANKVASTYSSLSLRAFGVDPVSALHGSLGACRESDLLVLLSKSGETGELVDLARRWREVHDARTLLVHSNRGCSLERLATRSVFLANECEADHLDLAPTASSTCLLAFMQALGVQLAQENRLTYDDFVATHPKGTIGEGRRRAE